GTWPCEPVSISNWNPTPPAAPNLRIHRIWLSAAHSTKPVMPRVDLKLRSGTQEMVSSMITDPLPLRHTTINLARLHAVMASQHLTQQVTCARCPAQRLSKYLHALHRSPDFRSVAMLTEFYKSCTPLPDGIGILMESVISDKVSHWVLEPLRPPPHERFQRLPVQPHGTVLRTQLRQPLWVDQGRPP